MASLKTSSPGAPHAARSWSKRRTERATTEQADSEFVLGTIDTVPRRGRDHVARAALDAATAGDRQVIRSHVACIE